MRQGTRRPWTGPVVFAATGVVFTLSVPLLERRLQLMPGGPAVIVLDDSSGIWIWLGLAWLTARCCDAVLRRVAIVTRGGVPYPRLLTDLLRVALFATAATMIVLFVFNQPATGLITVSSVVIAVIGFALRNVISDIFSGIALGIDQPYQIGDWIETVQGCSGRVAEITWRTTRLIDRAGFVIIVPNGLAAGQRLINYGGGERDYRVVLRVPLDARLSVSRAKRILLSGALDAGRHIAGLSPDVLLMDYSDGAAIYQVRFRVPDLGREAACRDQVTSCVLHALHCAGQTIRQPPVNGNPDPTRTSPREALLGQIDLFRLFDENERAQLAAGMRRLDLLAGQTVVRQGDAGDVIYVLAEGILNVDIARDNRPSIHDQLGPGAVFGEISLLTGQPRSATVTAEMEAVVYEISRDDLDPILRRRPEILEALAAVMAQRLAENERRGTLPEQIPQAAAVDMLARLRTLFHL